MQNENAIPETMRLVAAGNTYNPCLLVIRGKGYELSVTESAERTFWHANKLGICFLAYSPPELLGIVTLWESLGHNWNQQVPNIIGEITKAMPD